MPNRTRYVILKSRDIAIDNFDYSVMGISA